MSSSLVQVNWESQKKVLFSTLGSFRSKEIHTDITLSCEGESFLAHRLVLSMCSGFFKKSLQGPSSPCLVLICGIRRPILEALLNFMYDGTATIKNDDIPDLLKAGILLEIPGLMDMGNNLISNSPLKDRDMSDGPRVSSVSSLSNLRRNNAGGINFPRTVFKTEDKTPSRNTSHEVDTDSVHMYEQNLCLPHAVDTDSVHMYEECGAESREDVLVDSGEESDQNCDNNESITSHLNSVMKAAQWSKENSKHITPSNGGGPDTAVVAAGSQLADNQELKKVVSRKLHPCKICGKRYSQFESLQEHRKLHDAQAATMFPCNNCNKEFSSERVYITHIRKCEKDSPIHINRREPSLPMPKRKYHRRTNIEATKRTRRNSNEGIEKDSQEEIIDQCEGDNDDNSNDASDIVDKGLESSHSTVRRMTDTDLQKSVVTLNNKYCDLCDKGFTSVTQYKMHKGTDCIRLECPFCLLDFEFNKKEEYGNHVRSHKGMKHPYTCPRCSFCTDKKTELEDHISIHTGVYRFWCPLCDFQSAKLAALKTHTKFTHPGLNESDLSPQV